MKNSSAWVTSVLYILPVEKLQVLIHTATHVVVAVTVVATICVAHAERMYGGCSGILTEIKFSNDTSVQY